MSDIESSIEKMMTQKYEQVPHADIADMLERREANLRVEIDKLYERIDEVRRMRDNLWREVDE